MRYDIPCPIETEIIPENEQEKQLLLDIYNSFDPDGEIKYFIRILDNGNMAITRM